MQGDVLAVYGLRMALVYIMQARSTGLSHADRLRMLGIRKVLARPHCGDSICAALARTTETGLRGRLKLPSRMDTTDLAGTGRGRIPRHVRNTWTIREHVKHPIPSDGPLPSLGLGALDSPVRSR